METLVLTQMQIDILKTMIEAYENGSNVHLTFGMAAGKTTVMKIFNEYVRHKKENPDYKVVFSDISELFTKSGGVVNADTIFIDDSKFTDTQKLILKHNPVSPQIIFSTYFNSHTESGPINNAMIEEVRKRLKK